jgi:hypothetical protein
MDNVNTQKAAVELNIKNDRDLRASKISAGNEASAIFRNIFCCK